MTGTLQSFELKLHSFGEQLTTIDGQQYLTWLDLCDRKLKGLTPGCRVEFEARPAPTVLCHSPHVTSALPSANILRVVHE